MPKIINHFKGNLKDKKIAVWGLAFKPDTDDIREAPALYMIDALINNGAKISAFDPEAMNNVRTVIGDKIEYGSNEYDVLENADALLICTEWGIFRNPDFNKLNSLLNEKVIFDGRNLFETTEMNSLGYSYHSIGRNEVKLK